MSRDTRKALIEKIEEARGSKFIAYVTGDRQPAPAQIGDDAVRPLFDHLRHLGHVEKLDLFLYSRGGNIDVPWRIATALRAAADEWNVLIPFRANSAATLLALGADQIVMGAQGELGPIDPIMNIQRVMQEPGGPGTVVQESIPVEDIMSYVRFTKERAGIESQEALSASLDRLAERIGPVSLGNAYRTHSHIRDVAKQMILSRAEPPAADVIDQIVQTLAEQTYAHGHAVGRAAAQALNLPVHVTDDDLDGLMWDLLKEYEADLKLLSPIDPAVAIRSADTYREAGTIAVIESAWGAHTLDGEVEIRATRQTPNLNIALNLNLQLPQGVNPAAQQAMQQLLAALQPQIAQQAQKAVQDALRQQAPVAKLDAGFRGGEWKFGS